MYHVECIDIHKTDAMYPYIDRAECIDIHKTDKMYLYIDRACLCANNMYNVANFHIRNLMTGLKKDVSLRTENERSVIRTFASSIPAVNFSLRMKHFVKIFRIFLDRSLSEAARRILRAPRCRVPAYGEYGLPVLPFPCHPERHK